MSSLCTHPWTPMEDTFSLGTVWGVGGASKQGPSLDHQRHTTIPPGPEVRKAPLQGRALNTPP